MDPHTPRHITELSFVQDTTRSLFQIILHLHECLKMISFEEIMKRPPIMSLKVNKGYYPLFWVFMGYSLLLVICIHLTYSLMCVNNSVAADVDDWISSQLEL